MPALVAVSGPAEGILPDVGQERKIFGHSREADWAIGGAAIGFTAALVEFIANNVFDKDNDGFSSRKGEVRPVRNINKERRKFRDILDDANNFDYSYDDYDVTHRNRVHEDYNDNDDVYDYEDYSYSQFFQTTLPPETYQSRYDLETRNKNHLGPTRSPWKRRKSVTATRNPRRKQKQVLKGSRKSPITKDNPDSESTLQETVVSDSYGQDSIRKPKVINKSATVTKVKDTLQRRHFNQRDPYRANILRRVSSEYERQMKLEKQEAMLNRIMAYTSKNYNQQRKKYKPPINAYVGTDLL